MEIWQQKCLAADIPERVCKSQNWALLGFSNHLINFSFWLAILSWGKWDTSVTAALFYTSDTEKHWWQGPKCLIFSTTLPGCKCLLTNHRDVSLGCRLQTRKIYILLSYSLLWRLIQVNIHCKNILTTKIKIETCFMTMRYHNQIFFVCLFVLFFFLFLCLLWMLMQHPLLFEAPIWHIYHNLFFFFFYSCDKHNSANEIYMGSCFHKSCMWFSSSYNVLLQPF